MAANIDPNSAVYATDEYGRPFIIVREGQQKSRLSGLAAIRVSWKSAGRRDMWMLTVSPCSLIFLLQRLYPTLSRPLLVLAVRSAIRRYSHIS